LPYVLDKFMNYATESTVHAPFRILSMSKGRVGLS
jgi:hypothetical protein